MADFFELEPSGLGQRSSDPVMAAINGTKSLDEIRLANNTEFSAETADIDIEGATPTVGEDLLLVPQNAPEVLNLGKDGSELGKDPLTGETDGSTVGEADPLTGSNTDEVEIETRARKRDKAGNNLKKARNLGVLTDDERFREFVGKSDRKDFYKFRVKEKTDVDIELRGLSGNADLYLLNNRGKVIDRSAKGGKRAEDIERTLNPGAYYVRVQPKNNRVNANYTLSLDAELPDIAGNNLKTAHNLGVLKGDEKFQEFVGKSDRKDFYKFRVKEKTDIDIELRGLSGNADLYLLNNKGKVLGKSASGGKRAEDIERTLNPGAYYVRVQPKNKKVNANYSLSLDAELPDIAGNNLKAAHNLGVLKGGEKFQEFVGKSDRKDFYKFKVNEKTDVDIELRGLSGDADLYLLNNKRKVIGKSVKGGKGAEDIERTLNPGSYYVRVQPKNKKVNADYSLSLGASSSELEYAPDEILVKLKSEPSVTQTQSMMTSYGALAVQNLVQTDPNINSPVERWQLLKLEPGSDIEKLQKRLQKDSRVELAQLNYKVSIDSVPNDPDFDRLWGLNNTGSNGGKNDADIDAPEAWDTQKGSKDVIVAVVDTGVDYNHPDLADNIWKNAGEIPGNFVDDDRNGYVDDVYGFDWVNQDGNPMDDESHGTHVAGTIGAVGDNNRGVVGVSPNVSIMSLKFIGSNRKGSSYDAAQAIIYASNMGADVINASYGGDGYDPVHEDAIDYANKKGVLFVAAAGNNGTNNDGFSNYPSNSSIPNVISVAATDNEDRLAYFSNYGRNTVDLAAPGGSPGILSTTPRNAYMPKVGTSMAAPHVAGAAALVLAENPSLSVRQLKKILLDSTDSIASLQGKTVTGGRLNVNKAIQAASKPRDPDDFITVTSPNGGNTLEPGKSYAITWSDNIAENVKLDLYKGGSLSSAIASATESDGSYVWTVPASVTSGSDYQVKVTSVSNSSVADLSNSNFTIKPEDVITVTSPNGGNILEPGSSYTITWSDNIAENVKLDLYKGGSLSSAIASATESDGSYVWTVPASVTSGSDYQVKVTSVSNSSVADLSNSNFTIKPEDVITVTSPNGGNILEPGSSYTITWSDNIAENVKLDLYKGGSLSSAIASATESDGSYVWTVPASVTSGSDYQVKVTSVSDSSVSDLSNSNFTIKPEDVITVSSPNGGNTLEPGKSYAITWSDNIAENVKLELYKGGSLSSAIASSTESDGSYVWTVPASITSGSDYQVKVTSVSDSSVSDLSNSNFTIKPEDVITVTSPNGGNTLEPGSSYAITWSDNIAENVKLELYKGGSLSSAIASSTESDGSYVWTVPASITSGSDYQVKVTSVSDSSVSDLSNSNFTIKPEDVITVTSPNGGNTLEPGKSYAITWSDNIAENVKLELYKGGSLSSAIASSTESDGSYVWTVPASITSGSDYQVKVTSVSDSSVSDLSNSNFTIKPEDVITVSSPNGGNTLEPGKSYAITWSDNIAENVKLELYKGGSLSSAIASSTESDGSYVWTVPASITSGSDYQVKVTSVSDSSVSDLSNSNFTIKPEDVITVSSPNGGNTLEPGKSYAITWSDNIAENVKLELYKGGSLSSAIASSTESDGSYVWTVPASITSGSDYQVKVTSVSDSSVSDLSNSNFTIEPAGYISGVALSSSSVRPGDANSIYWSDNISENVKIELYKGGNYISTISASTPSDGSYHWAPPNDVGSGTDYQIKIASVNNNDVYDFTDSNFEIEEPWYVTVVPGSSAPTLLWNNGWGEKNVKLELYQGNSYLNTIVESMPAKYGTFPSEYYTEGKPGSHRWSVPDNLTSGEYKIILSSVGSNISDDTQRIFWSFQVQDPIHLVFDVGHNPNSVAIGEFNGDGISDLAVANEISDDVSVLLGSGNGSFSSATNFAVEDSAREVAAGEFNGDGISDLVVATDEDVLVLLGNGSGSFSNATNFSVSNFSPESIVVGEFNGDGISDLAVAHSGFYEGVLVLLGFGDGSFINATNFDVGENPGALAIGEFNGDGISDLVVANQGPWDDHVSGNVSVLLGNGRGSFSSISNFSVNNSDPKSVAVGEFNNDSISDFAVINGRGDVSVSLGNGDGSFNTAHFDTGGGSGLIAVGEFNDDGISDLTVVKGGDVLVLLGRGDGSFSEPTKFYVGGAGTKSVAVGEFNGDGISDVAVAQQNFGGRVSVINSDQLSTLLDNTLITR